eukprot:962613-Prymnesium_polylepis.1
MEEDSPWLSVQLPSRALVSSVIIYGRSDCCQEHLADYEVWVGTTPGLAESADAESRCQPDDTLTAPAIVGPFTVSCSLEGTYVTLLLPGASRLLMLDELVVVGRLLGPPALPPL